MSTSRGRPPDFAGGMSGSISCHCSNVKLLEYALPIALIGAVLLISTAYAGRAFLPIHSLLKHPLRRPLPDSVKFARANFEHIWIADGSTLEALFRKLKSL